MATMFSKRPLRSRQDEELFLPSSSMEVSSDDEEDEEAVTITKKDQLEKSFQEATKQTDGEESEKGNDASDFVRPDASSFKDNYIKKAKKAILAFNDLDYVTGNVRNTSHVLNACSGYRQFIGGNV